MVRMALCLVLALLPACGRGPGEEPGGPLEISIPTLPDPGGPLRMEDTRPGTRWQYRLEVRSHADRTVTLAVAFEEPAPEGMQVRLAGTTRIMRAATEHPVLVLVCADRSGRFGGAVRLTSPELPGWSRRFEFEGEVVDRPLEGAYLRARPPGLSFDDLRPGEERPFVFVLRNAGSENITVRDVLVRDRARVRLRALRGGELIVPGAELQVNGVLVAPREAGRFAERIRILSNAVNLPQGLTITIGGAVVPDYAPYPPRQEPRRDYPARHSTYKVEVRAREGCAPFTVASIAGHELYFDIVSKGGDEPSPVQRVEFRVKETAPTDVTRDARFKVRIRLAPVDEEVIWPVALRLLPPIHPQPARLNFGKVPFATPARREVLLATFGNRDFRVLEARSEAGKFVVATHHAPGLRWTVNVLVTRGLVPGQHRDTIVIRTDDPDVPEIHVPVLVEITRGA